MTSRAEAIFGECARLFDTVFARQESTLQLQAKDQDRTSESVGGIYGIFDSHLSADMERTVTRSFREAEREDGRRGKNSDVEDYGAPRGRGLKDGLGDPVNGTVAPDPGMPEWSPSDRGVG